MVFSMIFDLATLAIAFMAFTSTATAQNNVQINVYSSTDCPPDDYLNTFINGAASQANNCEAQCFPLPANGNASMEILTGSATCFLYNSESVFDSGSCDNDTVPYLRLSDWSQGCQLITPPGTVLMPAYAVVGMKCYMSGCALPVPPPDSDSG
jgi:hypothetical protein